MIRHSRGYNFKELSIDEKISTEPQTVEEVRVVIDDLFVRVTEENYQNQEAIDFAIEFQMRYLKHTPNIVNKLPMFEQILFLAKLKKNPLLAEVVAPDVEGEVTFELGSIHNPNDMADFIREGISKKETPQEKVDFLFGLNNVLLYSHETSWAENVERGMELFLRDSSDESFLISAYKNKLLDRANALPNERRHVRNIPEDVVFNNLRSSVLKIVPVSSDYYGVFDTNDFLIGFVESREVLQKGDEVVITYLNDGENLLDIPKDYTTSMVVLQEPKMKSEVEALFGIELTQFDMRIQLSILKFLSQKKRFEVELLAGEIKSLENQSDRENAFLVLLVNEDFEQIGGLMYHYNQVPDVARVVYAKYADMVSSIDEVNCFLVSHFKTKHEKQGVADITRKIREVLIGKANTLLISYYGDIHSLGIMQELAYGIDVVDRYESIDVLGERGYGGISSESKTMYDSAAILKGKILRGMEDVSKESLLFLTSFKSLIESGEDISLEGIQKAELATYRGGNIPQEIYDRMFAMYEDNRGDNSEANQELLLNKFSETVKNPKARFHTFTWNNELQAFVVFQDTSDGYAVGSAFNVKKDAQGYKVGEAMLTQVIHQEAGLHVLKADVVATNKILQKYLETGWVATRYFVENGDSILDIIQDIQSNQTYWGKTATLEAIMLPSVLEKIGREGVCIEVAKSQKELIEKYSNHFQDGLSLTRIVKNREGDMYYGVFEQTQTTIKSTLKQEE